MTVPGKPFRRTPARRATVLSTGVRLRLRLARLFKPRRGGRNSVRSDNPYGLRGKRLTGSEQPKLRVVRRP